MPIFNPSFIFIVWSLISLPALSQNFTGLFEGQRVVYSSTGEVGAYLLTLSSLKKINGEWIAEDEKLLEGQMFRRTYELSRPYSFETAWEHVEEFFVGRDATLIFECLGLACGSSNAWANERFGVKQLYGLDLSQRYQVWQLNQGSRAFASAYLVQRGNKRIYFHIDNLLPDTQELLLAPSAEVIARKFYGDGRIEVSGLSFQDGKITVDQMHLKVLANALNQQPFRVLTIVGHDFFAGTVEEQEQRSIAYAQAVYDALVNHGVQPKRMQVKGVGALTPDGKVREAKVVVLQ